MIIYINNEILKINSDEEYEYIYFELFKPFAKFREILHNISGFKYPSGFSLISENSIMENIYIGQEEKFEIELNIDNYKRIFIIDNYGGPEGGQWSWKGLRQLDVEKAFNVKFDNKIIEKIGGFPSNLMLCNPA